MTADFKRQIADAITYACLNRGYAIDAAKTLDNRGLVDERGTWENGYDIGYIEGSASSYEDWKLRTLPDGMTSEALNAIADGIEDDMAEGNGYHIDALRAWAASLSAGPAPHQEDQH